MPPPPPPPPENPDSGAPSLVRTYRVWQGSNVFLFGGRLIFGPDVKSIFISIFLVLFPVALFCSMVARKLLDDFPHHLGWSIMAVAIALTLFVLITLVVTSSRDPGIVPRSAHPPELDDSQWTENGTNGRNPSLSRIPRSKDVIVNGIIMKVKYCDTCMLYRPLRASHCSVCDNCVEKFDHHCPWVGQCIGLSTYENYRYRYNHQVNPYNKGIIKNFAEVFCTSIPPSKNRFRSKVPREPLDSYQRTGNWSFSPTLKGTRRNMELVGRSFYNERDEGESDYREGFDNEPRRKDSELTEKSLDLSRIFPTKGEEGQESGQQPGPLCEISAEVADSITEVGESNWASKPSCSAEAVV
ncbi:hypothetical protein Fmac_004091 [Flemingia macrophylla]|uniref:S-acyltransferase n=1 Tax=Flemingia macrophylla TaxID=520843 RepID=A0ABD1N3X5_9FABA